MEDHTSVYKQQRDGIWIVAPMMHKMDIQTPKPIHRDRDHELAKLLIQLLLLSAPVKLLFPDGNETLGLSQGDAHVPASIVKLIGEGCLLEFLTELVKLGIGNGDGKRRYGGHLKTLLNI